MKSSHETKIILATTSPRRIEIFGYLGIPFTGITNTYDEDNSQRENHADVTLQNAKGKANSVVNKYSNDEVVIGMDTLVVSQDGVILPKPKDSNDAVDMLCKLSGTKHRIITAYYCAQAGTEIFAEGTVTTFVNFRSISKEEARAYVAKDKDVLNIAGAYDHEHLGAVFIESIEGDFYASIGMPLYELANVLSNTFNIKALD